MGSYDPALYHDRLLLGLSGIMSEAELHQIRMRLHQGERQKAARGELHIPLPAGLAPAAGGGIMLNPDAEVHWVMRRTQSYAEAAHAEELERRIRELNAAGCMDAQIAEILNAEGLPNTRGGTFEHGTIHLLRTRWNIPTAKINGVDYNPPRWPDGSYSVQGAADALGITEQTVFKWLKRGRLQGRQLMKGQPWQIDLTDEQIGMLQAKVRRTTPSRRTAS